MYITQDAAFIHMPRTGGSFIKQTLHDLGIKNQPSPYKAHIGIKLINSKFPDRKLWTSVRNPIHHLRSFWACRWSIFMTPINGQGGFDHFYGSDCSFIEFIETYLENYSGTLSKWYRKKLTLDNRYPALDYFVKTEDLPNGLIPVLKNLEYPITKEQKRKIKASKKVNAYYKKGGSLPKSLKHEIIKAEQDLITTFGYLPNELL